MIEGIFLYGNDNLDEVFRIRKEVFQIEQSIDPDLEFDKYDKESIHILAKNDNYSVGTGRLVLNNDEYKIGRIAVLKEYRGNRYGEFIVKVLVDKAFSMSAEYVIVNSQVAVKDFYNKIGFIEEGEIFIEAGIEHIRMVCTKCNFYKCCR